MEIAISSDVFGLSSTERLCRNAVLHPDNDVVIMWWLCHLISWWGVGLNTSDLTQWSGLITRIASDLCQARQKYPCTVRSILGLQHLPPRMKNHGLNEGKKTYRRKNNLSIESSEVSMRLVWVLTTLSVRLSESWEKSEEGYSWLNYTLFIL